MKYEIKYLRVPGTDEGLPHCIDETQVCSGGEFCPDEYLECADQGTTMAIEMTVKLDDDVSA